MFKRQVLKQNSVEPGNSSIFPEEYFCQLQVTLCLNYSPSQQTLCVWHLNLYINTLDSLYNVQLTGSSANFHVC